MMRGGKYLGEGTYGCTLDPAPTCKGFVQTVGHLPDTNIASKATVGKVFTDSRSASEEWEVAQQLARIDPKQSYFLYPVLRCQTSMSELSKVEGTGMCANLHKRVPVKKKRAKDATLEMVKLPNGGVPLHAYVTQHSVSPQYFLASMLPVFRGIAKLVQHRIVHNDLKFDNILWNPLTQECRIIDFGLQLAIDDALSSKGNPYIFSNYWLHPPEYKIFASMHRRRWTIMDTADVRQMMADHLSAARIKLSVHDTRYLSDMILNGHVFAYCDYEKAYLQFVSHLQKNKPTPSQTMERISRYPHKIDVYSLGITLLHLMTHLNFSKTSPKVQDMMYVLVRDMIHPDPRKRASIQKCIRQVNALISIAKETNDAK